jgi:hypothetical protein
MQLRGLLVPPMSNLGLQTAITSEMSSLYNSVVALIDIIIDLGFNPFLAEFPNFNFGRN